MAYDFPILAIPPATSWLQVSVPLTSAQILAAHTSAVPIVPAPPVGFIIVGIMSVYQLIHGSETYTGGWGGLYYGNTNTQLGYQADFGDYGIFAGTSNSFGFGGGANASGDFFTNAEVNGVGVYYGIVEQNGNVPYTGGNGTGVIRYTYYLQAIS